MKVKASVRAGQGPIIPVHIDLPIRPSKILRDGPIEIPFKGWGEII